MQEKDLLRSAGLARIVTGALFVAFGVLAFLGAIELFDFERFVATSWPIFFVIVGLVVVLSDPKNWLWALILVLYGLVTYLNVNDMLSYDAWNLFWPVVFVMLGISIMTRAMRKSSRPADAVNSDRSDQFAFMSGSELRVTSKDYAGGKISALMGGVELDLRDAVIKKQAILDVFAVMGGVEVKVPAGVVVKSEVSAILGGVEVKADSKAGHNDPVLVITGTALLGGVEVKY